MNLKRHNRKSSIVKSCQLVVERLEPRQLLSAVPALQVSTTVVPFNAAVAGTSGAGPSRVESVTLKNGGSGYLIFDSGAFTIVGNPAATTSTPSAFTIVNAGSLPTQLAPGQSIAVELQYNPSIVGLQSAILEINSNDPTTPSFDVDLNGIGTPGQFGTDEPSLVQVLRAYDIPTIVGAGPNDVNINTQKYPANPDPSSQEVPMQRMVAANPDEPVTLTPIASFSSATPAISRIGYYTPGNPNALNELFYIGQADAQTVQPTAIGATSFEPGTSEFGLYGTFPGTTTPNGSLDTHFSEDALNTQDPSSERKIRFFPYKTKAGVIVPNTYVVAMEDYNDPSQYNSFINFVGIISNVTAAPNAMAGSVPSSSTGNNPATMSVEEPQLAPDSSTLVFNTIQKPNSIVADVVHNENVITITNTGDQSLVINSLTLSDTKNWTLVSPPAAGTSIPGGGSINVTIKFIATTNPPHTTDETNDTASLTLVPSVDAGGVWTGTLTINSSDTVNPTKTINLAGYWQIESEHENEPNISTLTNLMFGYSSNVTGSSSTQGTEYPNNGNTPVLYSSEVDPSTDQGLLIAADPSQPVSILEAAAFHQQYETVDAAVGKTTEGVESGSESGNTVTITTDGPTTFATGQQVTISGSLEGYDGTFTITSTPTTSTFTYTDSTSGLATAQTAVTQPQTGWYLKGGSTKWLFKDQPNNGQSVLPLQAKDSYSTVETSFTPTGAFGLNFDGMKSQDSSNSVDLQYNTSEHALRFFPMIDASGNVVPNTYIVGMDYRNYATPNGDYQDLYEIVSNVTFEALPATPIDLHASEGTSGVNLKWAPVSNAASYNVYQVVNGTQVKLNSSPVTSTSYVDATATPGTSVEYHVTAVGSSGLESSAMTASINVSGIAPAAPAIQTADGSSGTQVSLTWTAVSGATSYVLSREAPGANSYTVLASGITATSYNDTAVAPGSTYSYVVQAEDTAGLSPMSAPVSATVMSSSSSGLAAPTINQADGSSGTQVVLGWTAVTGATSYSVEREAPGQTSFVALATGLTGTSYVDTSVLPGATYQYEIQATGAAGASPLSAPSSVSVATSAATLPAPTNVQADASSGTQVVVTWAASAGATSYNVLREAPGSTVFVQAASGLTTTSYTDTSIIAGATYEYEIEAINGSAFSADSTPATATLPSPGATAQVTVGKTTNKSVKFSDADGTVTTITMTGPGVATVNFTGSSIAQNTARGAVIVSGSGVAVASISITGASGASGLTITTKGGNGTVTVGSISSDGSLNHINARTTSLIGGLSITGGARTISLGSANATAISVGGTLQNLQIGTAMGVSLISSGPIGNVQANTWNSAGMISAPTINSINIKGDATLDISAATVHSLHVKGTLSNSMLTLSGAAGTNDLAMLSAGSIATTVINAVGNIGSISASTLTSSEIYAGVASVAILPSSASDFSAMSSINSVTLKKIAGTASLVDSSIAASLVKHVALGYVQFSNGGKQFGLAAESVNSLTLSDLTTGKTDTFTKLLSEAIVTADLAAKAITPQDFVIQIV